MVAGRGHLTRLASDSCHKATWRGEDRAQEEEMKETTIVRNDNRVQFFVVLRTNVTVRIRCSGGPALLITSGAGICLPGRSLLYTETSP